ncbi:helix-turn-helix domain-containing protein [Micromonospora sp. NPDC050417]|uniref:helix-turn-helix domain-containing protein n=1 Tax=Micromonospora sp. NPDC050417 TaxID=3364280 RepID=UPI00379B9E4C
MAVDDAELPIGRRVAYWRGRRKMSQQVFADRLGKSKSWVDKIERGARRLDKFSVLHDMAAVLQLSVDMLIGQPATTSAVQADAVELDDLRLALTHYAPAAYLGDRRQPAGLLSDLTKSVSHAWLTYQHGRYDILTRALPGLLRDAHAADAYYSGDSGERAASLLGQVYQITSSALRKLGAYDLARLSAERSITIAVRQGDALLAGTGTTRFANALLAEGQVRSALEANVATAHRLAPDGTTWADADRVSVYGSLLLQGAMAAAHLGDSTSVRELLGEAKSAADTLGSDQNRYWTSFGPTNVELHRAAAAVELGDGSRARAIHASLTWRQLGALMPERRAQHLLDQARAHILSGDMAGAGEALIEADRLAPSDIRNRPAAQDVMVTILRRTPGSPPTLVAELADRMGARV